jgi:hypothetical protein
LADACFIGEPDFDGVSRDTLFARDRIQFFWELFLNSSMAPAACA